MDTIKSKASSITFRETPWDKKIFGLKTYEILDMKLESFCEFEDLQREFLLQTNADFVNGRFCATDLTIKKALLLNEFQVMESSLQIYLPSLKRYNPPMMFKSKILSLELFNSQDLEDLKSLAAESFHFSRFHENPFFKKDLADKRVSSWVEDLVHQGKTIWVFKDKKKIVAFIAFDLVDDQINLILGGCRQNFGLYAPYFWNSFLLKMRDEGVGKKVFTVVSAANVGVLNIYFNMGFRVKKSFLDYQKIIRGNL